MLTDWKISYNSQGLQYVRAWVDCHYALCVVGGRFCRTISTGCKKKVKVLYSR